MKGANVELMINANCKNCGKPESSSRSGSITSYFFQHNYCQCELRRNKKSALLNAKSSQNSQNKICSNCGKAGSIENRAGSFTAFMFKELRCQCSSPNFGNSSLKSGKNRNANSLLKRTDTAARILHKQELAKKIRSQIASSHSFTKISVGSIIGGKFELQSIIGEGGMGVVYLAQHLGMKQKYALKILSPPLVSEQYWLRFQAEAKTLASLQHPNLINVYDLGVHENSIFFYSMDFLEGRNLDDILATEGPQSVERTIEIFLAVLDGLAYAHRNGVVHRDIKPANIFICERNGKFGADDVKILDFGIAKSLKNDFSGQQLTAAGEVFGSPYYMSPEQGLGEDIDVRSDIYSVGCSIFETLTGFVPFDGKSAVEIALCHQQDQPPTLAEVSERQFPDSLDLVIDKCLAKLPRNRYQSAKEVAIDLLRIKEGKDISAYSKVSSSQSDEAIDDNFEITGVSANLRLVLAITIAIALVTFFSAGWWLYSQNNSVALERYDRAITQNQRRSSLDQPTQMKYEDDLVGHDDSEKVKVFLQSKPGNYAQQNKTKNFGQKLFVFPDQFSIGTLHYWNKVGASGSVGACGKQSIPVGCKIAFSAGDVIGLHPQLLQYFRPDDLQGFSILRNGGNSVSLMPQIAKMTSLQTLRLPSFLFQIENITDLDRLRNLRELTINTTNIDAITFSKCKLLPNLTTFDLTTRTNIEPILNKLNDENLVGLRLHDMPLSKEDVLKISRLKALRSLTIDNSSITSDDIRALTALTNLKTLDIRRCQKVDAKCIGILKKIKNLSVVYLPVQVSENLKDEIHENVLPKIKILE